MQKVYIFNNDIMNSERRLQEKLDDGWLVVNSNAVDHKIVYILKKSLRKKRKEKLDQISWKMRN